MVTVHMEIRPAAATDHEAIRDVAEASLDASYSHAVDDDTREQALKAWYDPDTVADRLDDDATAFIVAIEDGSVVGVVQGEVIEGPDLVGRIDWLHVDPKRRGEGVGSSLLSRIEQRLREQSVDVIEGRVLAANTAGGDFYVSHSFSETTERTVEIGGREFTERRYRKRYDGEEPTLSSFETDAEQLYIATDERERGSAGPFYPAYTDTDRNDRYGYVCGPCNSTDVGMDPMGRLECSDCGNARKPTRWDAAYL
ncbi:Ribosomal protein S18 acetylase RimI [Halohasta litchfieldiae]|jgi:Acetyltransferases|uniref:Ribosomal protein S18 acetylase RimI n=2 Tax=Halohasta litchfieldiae TaxID=1073996 RepID=A0A1H6XUI9_9EURY|nr:Ribosomal protein S18 acetylase RimI [Halohasta litchfieldiae]